MSPHLMLLLSITVLPAILGAVYYLRSKSYDSNEEHQATDSEKEKMFQDMLVEGEELKAYCVIDPKNNYYCAVTNMRIIIERKDGNKHIYFEHIKNVKYQDAVSNNVSPTNSNVRFVTVVVDKNYLISRSDEKYLISSVSAKFSNVVAAIAECYKK